MTQNIAPPSRAKSPEKIADTILYLIIFFAAALPRIVLGYFYPYDGLDWPIVYRVVAENIYLNHCVSQSPPLTGLCLPHWGGNQLPGFPAFVALAWSVFGKSDFAIILGQSLVTACAICRLSYAVRQLTNSIPTTFGAGILLALSPVSIGWSRSLNTEALAIAGTILVLAELLLSLAGKRLRVWTLGFALACAVFIRYDLVLLSILVAFCAFAIHRPANALQRGAAVALVLATPLLLWTARSISLGLPPIPAMNVVASINSDGSVHYPAGLKKYALTWLIDATDMRTFTMPAYNGSYQQMSIPDRAFDTEGERIRVTRLLAQMSKLHDKPIPKNIDDAFGELAAERYSRHPLRQAIWLPLLRLKSLWFNPFYSWGLPIGFEDANLSMAVGRQLAAGGTRALAQAAMEYPGRALGKLLVNAYFLTLLVAFMGLLSCLPGKVPRYVLVVSAMAFMCAISRSIFLAWVAQVETRYIVECVPAIEISVVLGWNAFWQRNRETHHTHEMDDISPDRVEE
jgi:hypothetical protein